MIEVKVFYKIFPYEIKNIIMTLVVFCSFYFIKVININVQNLIGRLFANFSLSLLTAVFAISVLYFLQRKKYNYKKVLPVFSDFKKIKQS